MKKNIAKIFSFGMLISCLSATAVNAALVTSITGGSVFAMPELNYFGSGPQSFGSGTTWSSTDSFSVFGYTGGYGFADNGYWTGLSMAGLNNASGTMKFAFNTPVSAVGGLLNYAAPHYGTPVIAVYDAQNNLIENATLSFSTGNTTNTGMFYGFQEASAIISYFTLSNAYIGLTDLTVMTNVTGAPLPFAATTIIFGSGFIAILGRLKRKFNA